MLAMQYSIPLPNNFNAEQIRARVEERRLLFDAHEGLVHKSFIYNQEDHLYAPFYIWEDVTKAQDFLLDQLFKGVIETFNRQRVRSWFVFSLKYNTTDFEPEHAQSETDPVPTEAHLDKLIEREREVQEELMQNKDVYMHALALDADRWEILRFSLWRNKSSAPKPAADVYIPYEVLHVSEPA